MATIDDFDAALAERASTGIYQFRLGGRDWQVPTPDIEQMAEYAEAMQKAEQMEPVAMVRTFRTFVADCLRPEDREAFAALRPPLDIVMKIATRIAEAATGVPFDTSSPSSREWSAPSGEPLKDDFGPRPEPTPST